MATDIGGLVIVIARGEGRFGFGSREGDVLRTELGGRQATCSRAVRPQLVGLGHILLAGRLASPQPECLASRRIIPFCDEDLRFFVRGSIAGPCQLGTIGGEHREAVESVGGGDSDGFVRPGCIDEIKLKVREALEIRRKDHVIAAGMKVRSPAHRPQLRNLLGIRTIDVRRVDLCGCSIFAESTPAEAFSIR